jgi:hypothetical protein
MTKLLICDYDSTLLCCKSRDEQVTILGFRLFWERDTCLPFLEGQE